METSDAQADYEQLNEYDRNQVELWMACYADLTFEQAVEIVVGNFVA